jgi:hypothetical protein
MHLRSLLAGQEMKLLCAIVFLAYGCVTSKGGVQNFPESSLDERKDRHERLDGWYSKHLKRMKEP